MRKFKYSGNSCSLGRFGLVSSGDTLELTEQEAISVLDNDNFKAIREAPLNVEGCQFPPQGKYADLNTVRWEDPRIFKEVAKMKRTKLTNMMMQLEASGYPVPKIAGMDNSVMRDYLLETARKAGWM
jgi:hypothetical protein